MNRTGIGSAIQVANKRVKDIESNKKLNGYKNRLSSDDNLGLRDKKLDEQISEKP
jgi:hypothetical protein